MIPPWILQSPLAAGRQAMEAGGRLGLAARGEDLRAAAQADAAAEASDRLGLSMQEMQARREQAAAQLAESLRQHNALEQYRKSELDNSQARIKQTDNAAAALSLQRGQQQQNWQSEFRLKEQKAAQADTLKTAINTDSTAFFKDLSPESNPADLLKKYPLAGHDPAVRSLLTQSAITGRLNTRMDFKPTLEEQAIMDQLKPMYLERAKAGGGGDEGQDTAITVLEDQLDAVREKRKASKPAGGTRLKWNSKKGTFE